MQWRVLALALSGFAVAVLNPPFQVCDESNHFFRAFQISEGNFNPSNPQRLPRGLLEFSYQSLIQFHPLHGTRSGDIRGALVELANENWDFGTRVDAWFPMTTAVYSPTSYLFSAAGIWLGRFLELSLLTQFYLGRLANVLVGCLLLAFALRLDHGIGRSFWTIAFIPVALVQLASFSADAIANASAIAWVAWVTSRSRILGLWPDRLVATALAIAVGLSKFAYAPMLLLAIAKRWHSRERRDTARIAVASGLSAPLLWSLICASRFQVGRPDSGVDPSAQFASVLSNPMRFLDSIGAFFVHVMPDAIINMVGLLGWENNAVPYPLAICCLFWCVFIFWTDSRNLSANESRLAIPAIGITGGITSIVLGFLYVTWTPVGAQMIDGFHGRYWIPMLPLLPVALSLGGIRGEQWSAQFARHRCTTIISPALGITAVFWAIFERYHWL